MEMSDVDILSHICDIVKLERFPLKQYPLGEVVGLFWFCFVSCLHCLDLGNASIVL